MMAMKVFKFGGASVKNAESVRNVASILKMYEESTIVVIISAMGKMTNAFEGIWKSALLRDKTAKEQLQAVQEFHGQIISELFEETPRSLASQLEAIYNELEDRIKNPITAKPNYFYDQIVSNGEIISTLIVSAYLQHIGVSNRWIDARKLVKTDYNYREAKVDWNKTRAQIKAELLPYFESGESRIAVSQGFIGGADHLNTTTLGREGSDYSAAIFAYSLDAEQVSIWKDVPGVLNADPRQYPNAELLSNISYKEAVELAYYGASVIHPKTIQPLQNKNIPLWVKSFVEPEKSGTLIDNNTAADSLIPSFIVKQNQRLISIATRDFAFIVEDNLSDIFHHFANHGVKINIMQNSAINFSVGVDEDEQKLEGLLNDLSNQYEVRYNTPLDLVTIRHFTPEIVDELTKNRNIIVEQRTRNTVRFLIR
tara:strand:- start:844 stop:2121 length:1278 start_codon:yes stop_codon:yes gene_type:complete